MFLISARIIYRIVIGASFISDTDKVLIKAFMQGTAYSWVKNLKGEKLAVRDLVGGENLEWKGTPLYVLYKKHIDAGNDDKSAL